MTSDEPKIAITADKPTKISIIINAGILTVALGVCAMLYEIISRQSLMEQRQAFAQERTASQLGVVSDDIKELSSTMKDGFKDGTVQRVEIGGRVSQLEKDYLRLENRVSNLEQ